MILTGRSYGSSLGPSEVYGTLRNKKVAKSVASGFDYWEMCEDTISSDRTVNNSYALVYESEVDASRDSRDERIEDVRVDAEVDESGISSCVNVSTHVDVECKCGEMITLMPGSPGCEYCGEVWEVEHE